MKTYHIITMLLLLLFVSCTENKEANALFTTVDSLLEEHPDSALSMLNRAYNNKGEWRKSQQMRYELLRAKAQNKAYVDFTTDSIMKEVAEYYDNHGTANEQMEAHYLLGCTYRDLGESPMALSCYLDATEKADTLSDDCDYGTLMRIWGQVANEFDRQSMPYKELEANNKFMKYAMLNNDTLSYVIGIEHKSNVYAFISDTTNLVLTIKEASHLFSKMGRQAQSTFVLSRLIPIYIEKNELEKAELLINKFEKETSYFNPNGDIIKGKEYYYKYKALFYEKIGALDSAQYYYKRLSSCGYEYDAYTKLLDIFASQLRPDSIYKYSKLKEQAFAKNFTNYHTQSMFNADGMFNYSRNQRIALEKEKEANRNLKITFATILCSLLVLVLLYNRYKHSIRQKERANDKMKMDYMLMQERYTRTMDDLKLVKSDYSEYIKAKEQELEEAKSCLKDNNIITIDITEQENVNNIMQCAEMVVFLNILKPGISHCPTNKDWTALTSVVASELPIFYARITKDNTLSRSELQATILTRLGFSTTELSFIMDKPIQRISNLKSLANQKLFGSNGAKNFYENLLET